MSSPDVERTPLQATARRWPTTLLLVVLGTALGVVAASEKPTTYTAETRMAVGGADIKAQAVPGFALASSEIAANYARFVSIGPVRTALVTGKNLSPAEADEVFRLLRGVSPGERADPTTLDRLLVDLQSAALPLRELALSTLIGLADPDERARVTAPPFAFDVGGPEEVRQAGERAWKRRVDDLKKRLEKGPAPKLGRDTGG